MLCRPRTTETVKTFRLTASRSAGTVALVMTDLRSDQTTVRICREDELYPVSKTHYADGANLLSMSSTSWTATVQRANPSALPRPLP